MLRPRNRRFPFRNKCHIVVRMEEERWLPIPGYEGFYDVSDCGRVRAWFGGRWRRPLTEPKILSSKAKKYPAVSLSKDGRRRNFRVHVLVLTAFVGPAPPHHEGCHEDGTKTNNRLGNLRWDTRKGNMADASRHGTTRGKSVPKGEAHVNARLTSDDVRCIRAEPRTRNVIPMLARCFGVSVSTINKIRGRDLWAHLPEPAQTNATAPP
jgi:HNH endonuclease/NUMOD4 motif-containing protein